MTTDTADDRGLLRWREDVVVRVGRVVFADRLGLALWLGLVLTFALWWRIGFFLTDTHTVANTVVALSQGNLAVTELTYPLDSLGRAHVQPGLHGYEGAVFGRNYGQAAAAVPTTWFLQGLTPFVAPRLLLAGGWSLGLLAFARQVGHLLADVERATVIGSALGIGTFATNLVLADPLDPRLIPLVALQMTTIFAAGFVALLIYRLVRAGHSRRVALAAGIATGLATPVGFWASLPKRHVLVAALTLVAVVAFGTARRQESTRHRALAYGACALVAWVHAFVGFFVVVTFATVDLATASSTDRRTIALVGLVLLGGLAPTFATNTAITGNPFHAPRLLPSVGGEDVTIAPDGALEATNPRDGIVNDEGLIVEAGENPANPRGNNTGAEQDRDRSRESGSSDGGQHTATPPSDRGTDQPAAAPGGGGDRANGGEGPLDRLLAWVAGIVPRPPPTALIALGFVTDAVTSGIRSLSEPSTLWHVFVRSGHIPGLEYAVNAYETIELTMLESAPLLGGLLALPAVALATIRRRDWSRFSSPGSMTPDGQTDLLVLALGSVFTLIYLSRLPIQSQLTVRYLLPVFPLGIYGLARIGVVREAVDGATRSLAFAYAAAAVIWCVGSLLLTSSLGLALGEAVQLHALVALVTATVVAGTCITRAVATDRVPPRSLAVALGVTGGVTTAFLIASALVYFRYAPFALDIVRAIAEILPAL